MRSNSGQAVVEQLGTIACVVAVLVGSAVVLGRTPLPNLIRSAIVGDGPAPQLSAEELAISMATLEGGPGAPRVDDAVALVGSHVGERVALRLVAALAYDVELPSMFGRAEGESETQTGHGTALVVSRAAEVAAIRRLDASSRYNARANLAIDAAAIGVGAVSVVPDVIVGGIALVAQRDTGTAALPAGAEAGDVVVCVPITWRSTTRHGARATRAALVPGGAPDIYRDRLRSIPSALLVTFRRGTAIERRVLAFRGCP